MLPHHGRAVVFVISVTFTFLTEFGKILLPNDEPFDALVVEARIVSWLLIMVEFVGCEEQYLMS